MNSTVIEIDPSYTLMGAVFAATGEGVPHVDAFTEHPNFDWYSWSNDKARMLELIRVPLREFWDDIGESRQTELKQCLQYLLNHDKDAAYKPNEHMPLLKSKEGTLTQSIFNSFQDTVLPVDGYAFCEWMWEVLFGDEIWRTDVRNWVVRKKML